MSGTVARCPRPRPLPPLTLPCFLLKQHSCARLGARRRAVQHSCRVVLLTSIQGPHSGRHTAARRVLFVRNLPFNISAEEMYEIFGKFGAIRQIRQVPFGSRSSACARTVLCPWWRCVGTGA